MRSTADQPLWDLVEESLDEAVFLWKRWEDELGSLTRNVDEVWLWTEDRLHGALDGVRAAGELMAERLIRPRLAAEDPVLWTVCGHVLAAGSPANARMLLAAEIRAAQGVRLDALVRGIEFADLNGTFAPVTAALMGGTEEHRAALCRLKAFRRAAPGPELAELLRADTAGARIAALRAAAVAPDDTLNAAVDAAIRSDDAPVRFAAIECGIRRRLASAWLAARELARTRHPDCGRVLAALAMLGDVEDRELVFAALREPRLQASALYALGHIGTPRAAETCLDGMRDPKLARPAGEAYAAITGVDLDREELAASEPTESEASVPFEADALDADLVPKPTELWPLPDPDAVRRHWHANRAAYAADVRHVRGRPASLDTLVGCVERAPMLRRPDFILELSVRSAGRYDVEPRASVRVQRDMMAAGRAALATVVA